MTKQFRDGVMWFTTGRATIDIYFPEDEIKCQYCKFCRSESELGRYWCKLTSNMIYNPCVQGLPDFCPVMLTGEIRGKKPRKE